MKVIGALILAGICGFLGYQIWSFGTEKHLDSFYMNYDYVSRADEVVIWNPLKSELNLMEIPFWEEFSSTYNASKILSRLNTSLARDELKQSLSIQIVLNDNATSFWIKGANDELLRLAKTYFDTEEILPGKTIESKNGVGFMSGNQFLISSSKSAMDSILILTLDENQRSVNYESEQDLVWISKRNANKWLSYDEVKAGGEGKITFKKRKGFVYGYAFLKDSLMKNESLDVTYSIWDFQLAGRPQSFSIENFPIRELDTETITDVEDICECDVKTAWKSWNSNQVYLFQFGDISFYGLQCLDDLPARTGLYPFIADNAEMYKGFQIQQLISGAEVGGLYADMFGREVSHYLDLENQVFFFSSVKEAKEFINNIQNTSFNQLVNRDLQELLLLSPSYTAYNANSTGNKPFVYQFEKQDGGRYFHALWKTKDSLEQLENNPSEQGMAENEVPTSKWEKQLDSPVIGTPFVFTNHYTKEKELVIQTTDRKLILIDSKGKVLWEREIKEEIKGNLHQVDLFRNNKFQLVFSTENKIYAIDRNGKNVENFPIVLPELASAPVSVLDYDGKRKYRLLIPLKDGTLKNYDKTAAEVKGWKHAKENSAIISPVVHTQAGRKDYLICVKENNQVAIYKRDGKPRYSQDLKLSNYDGKPLAIVPSNSIENVQLMYEDVEGNIIQVQMSLDDNNSEMLGLASSDLALTDFIVDNEALDYLLAKDHKVFLYNEKQALKFSNEYPNKISSLYFQKVNKRGYILVNEGNNIHVLNSRGEELNGFPVYGKGCSIISDINRDGQLELVTSDDQGLILVYSM